MYINKSVKNNTTNTVKIGKEIKEGGFREAWHCLPYNKLAETREEICKVCFWNTGTFWSKVSGKRYFTVFEIREIEKYFAAHNLDAWTGVPLKPNK